jgi:hypothetical protein
MTVTYHSGRRIQGTQADFDGTPAVSGGWKEVGRTTLGSAGNTIDVTSLADKQYLMVLTNILQNGDYNLRTRMNGDSGSNYSYRESANGASDTTSTSTDLINFTSASNTTDCFNVGYAANLSSKEKLWQSWLANVRTAGAGTAPYRGETVGKHAQTSNPISQFNIFNNYGSNKFASGSEVVVLGWDPSDTHTTNFWEELYSGTGTSLDTGVGGITSKKYLWVQGYLTGVSTGTTYKYVVNGDTGSNYAQRLSVNGSSDSTFTNNSNGILYHSGQGSETSIFFNSFIINNSSNEKLVITNNVYTTTAGAGTSPSRQEIVSKWANTSAQITDIQLTGTYGTNSILKVWGSN